jgi:hypothetical protein
VITRLKLLDLFCCAGGAGMGYHLAGFDVPARHRLAHPRSGASPGTRAPTTEEINKVKSEPDSVRFYASDYADKLTFDAVPEWLTAALESGDIMGVFKGEDYWYLQVCTAAGVVTAEPGDTIHKHYDGGLLVRSPEGLCKKTSDDEPRVAAAKAKLADLEHAVEKAEAAALGGRSS